MHHTNRNKYFYLLQRREEIINNSDPTNDENNPDNFEKCTANHYFLCYKMIVFYSQLIFSVDCCVGFEMSFNIAISFKKIYKLKFFLSEFLSCLKYYF